MGVPSNIIVPFVGVEFDNSRASKGPAVLNIQTLIFGQKITAGTGVSGQVIRVSSADEVGVKAGFGSQIHQIAKAYFKNNAITDTFIYMLEDEGTGTEAEYSITFTGSTIKAGELDIYIDGYRIPVSVAEGATVAAIATSVAAAINAELANLPISTATATLGVVDFAAKNAGTVANGLDMRLNYNDGEITPAGLTVAFAVDTTGTVDPEVDGMLADLGEEWYQVLVGPYTDATNLGLIEDELADRAGILRQIDGVYITAKKGDNSSLITYATNSARNSQYVITVACNKYPQSVMSIAGMIAGQVAASIADDAAKPLHRIALSGAMAPIKEDRQKLIDRNALALSGLMTLDPSLGVQTEAVVTMYLKNSSGASDKSYQQANSVFTLMVLRFRFRTQILIRYPRAKLADNADNIGPGQQIITPAIGKSEAIVWFRQAELDGLVENFDQFKNDVQCVRDPSNRNRLNWNLSPDLMNQFIVGSAQMQFIS